MLASGKASKNQPFLSRLRFALDGIAHALCSEYSLRTQGVALVLIVLLLVVVRPGALWWALVSLAASSVLTSELMNTALERLADHLHPDVHPQIRIVKDCAAGAVLVSTAGALAVGIALLVALIGRA